MPHSPLPPAICIKERHTEDQFLSFSYFLFAFMCSVPVFGHSPLGFEALLRKMHCLASRTQHDWPDWSTSISLEQVLRTNFVQNSKTFGASGCMHLAASVSGCSNQESHIYLQGGTQFCISVSWTTLSHILCTNSAVLVATSVIPLLAIALWA
jgi:hypothetical protein